MLTMVAGDIGESLWWVKESTERVPNLGQEAGVVPHSQDADIYWS